MRLIKFSVLVLAVVAGIQNAWALVDPTEPPAANESSVVEQAGDLHLSSILIASDRRLAVLDGQFVTEGDEVAGYKVTAIEPGELVLESSQGIKRLSLLPSLTDFAQPEK